ncbi:MAG: hypothetical protein M3315_17110 [Actinomycetota bacterium]|nr:hypothetical protein [Actinomycetota bacterium]
MSGRRAFLVSLLAGVASLLPEAVPSIEEILYGMGRPLVALSRVVIGAVVSILLKRSSGSSSSPPSVTLRYANAVIGSGSGPATSISFLKGGLKSILSAAADSSRL